MQHYASLYLVIAMHNIYTYNAPLCVAITTMGRSAEREGLETGGERWTSIRVRRSTAERLKQIGRKDETYDEIIVKLIQRASRRRA